MSHVATLVMHRAPQVVKLDKELTPSHAGRLSHEEKMEIARAVMAKNKNVLAQLAK